VVQSWKHELIRKKKHWNARKTKLFILKKKKKKSKKGEFFLHLWKEIKNDWQECVAL
jgi:hypothetical protein